MSTFQKTLAKVNIPMEPAQAHPGRKGRGSLGNPAHSQPKSPQEEALAESERERGIWNHLRSIWRSPGSHLGDLGSRRGIWEASGRHLRGIWEASVIHLGGMCDTVVQNKNRRLQKTIPTWVATFKNTRKVENRLHCLTEGLPGLGVQFQKTHAKVKVRFIF